MANRERMSGRKHTWYIQHLDLYNTWTYTTLGLIQDLYYTSIFSLDAGGWLALRVYSLSTRAVGPHLVAKLLQFVHRRRGEDVRADGQRLPEFDVRWA
eukprot:4667126-Pyramimonas_sp.AAC.2